VVRAADHGAAVGSGSVVFNFGARRSNAGLAGQFFSVFRSRLLSGARQDIPPCKLGVVQVDRARQDIVQVPAHRFG
jgi:hypothetical protein